MTRDNPLAPLNAYEAYRAGYAAGYFRGRVAQTNGEPYDDRTPVEREGGAQLTLELRDGTLEVPEADPWDNEKDSAK